MDNSLQPPSPEELQLVLKTTKITYQKFLTLLLDKEHTQSYFRQRQSDLDSVVRKIDRLEDQLEYELCGLINLYIQLALDAEYLRK